MWVSGSSLFLLSICIVVAFLMNEWDYIHRYYSLGLFVMLLFSCVVLGCIPTLQIIVERNLIDSAIKGFSSGVLLVFVVNLLQFIVLMLLNSLLKVVVQYGTNRHNLAVCKRLDYQRVEKCKRVSFSVLESKEFHELYGQAEKAGENDSVFFASLQTVLKCAVQVVTSFVVLAYIDIRTAFVVYAMLIFGMVLNRNVVKNSGRIWNEYIRNMRHANYLSALLLHREYATERKVFDYSSEIENRYSKDCTYAMQRNSRLGRRRFFSEFWITIFSVIYSITAILLLSFSVKGGEISIGSFIAAFTAVGSLRNVANQLYAGVFDTLDSFDRMSGFFAFLKLKDEENVQLEESIDLEKRIEFQHVTFSYPGAADPVLQDVCFTLNPGMHYALVGENGCGKTTLVKLLLGLYQPTEGRVLVGGKDVSRFSYDERRWLFSVIFQDFYRYPLSIRENVSLGFEEPQGTDAIFNVLDVLGFEAPIRFKENGIDTNLGLLKHESSNLSGGEWQKLAVARSVLSSSQIVVLDEPNAALDPVSEMAFYKVYEEVFASRTTLFVSHRLGAVKSADCILVIKDKHLVAMDSHCKLVENCEYYRQLFETQRGLYYETE